MNKNPYGSYKLIDRSILVEGDWKYESIFGDPTCATVRPGGTSVPYDMCLMDLSARDAEGGAIPLEGNTRIFYFKKLTSTTAYKLYDGDSDTTYTLNNYGYAGHLSDVKLESSDYDLNFSNNQSPIYNKDQWVSSSRS